MTSTRTKNRKLHMDVLRCIAIYMVLFNHTSKSGFTLFTIRQESPLCGIYVCWSIFIKIAVPLFFMISGALLLGKEESIRTIIQKRFLRFAIVLVVASFIMYVYTIRNSIGDFSIKHFLKLLYSDGVVIPYWYLYSYLAYILLLPFLRKIAQRLSNKEYLYMIVIYIGIQCLNILQFLIWKGDVFRNQYFVFFFMENNIFFPLLGYFLENRLLERYINKRNIICMAILSVVSIILIAKLTLYRCNLLNDWSDRTSTVFFFSFIFIPAATVYLGCKLYFSNHVVSDKVSKFISGASATTFGIYLFETIYREQTAQVFEVLKPRIHDMPACLIWILCACILGMIITWVIRKIPLVRKYI